MKAKSLMTFLTSVFATFAVVGCTENGNQNQTYDGRVFDISIKQDKSLTATSKKVGTNYTLEISGEGEAIDYNKKEAVPWNPIIKKLTLSQLMMVLKISVIITFIHYHLNTLFFLNQFYTFVKTHLIRIPSFILLVDK